MKKYILIEADTNDGDYVTEKSEITDEQIEQLKPLIEAIKNFTPYNVPGKSIRTHYHNYPKGECVRADLGEKAGWEYYQDLGFSEELIQQFDQLVPYGEYGIHTIKSIDILVVQDEIKLL